MIDAKFINVKKLRLLKKKKVYVIQWECLERVILLKFMIGFKGSYDLWVCKCNY